MTFRCTPNGPSALVLVCGLLFVVGGAVPARGAAARPNIVVILADDLGYSDIGCYGGEIATPNLDNLAAGGLRFSQFYNGGRCCPTRASLLTGLYPHQAGIGRMTTGPRADLPGYRGTLAQNTVTLAEALRGAGYRTAMVGKWHVSLTEPGPEQLVYLSNRKIRETFSDPKTYPVGRGFEEHYGIIWGVANYFDPFSLVHNSEPVREVPKGYYITDALTDHAVEYVEKYGKGPEPMLLYVAYTAPHWPLQAPKEDIDKYEERYAAGWEAVREGRLARMRERGVMPAGVGLAPAQGRKTSWAENPTKAWDARAFATHAAMIDRMDRGIGRIVEKLRETGRLEDTLILFLSDNGASPEAYPQPGFDRPAQTRDGRKIAYPPDKTVMPGGDDTFFGMGPAWANVSNAPFRYWKAEMYEGGICTPLVVHWPKGVTAERGSVTGQVGHVIDVMATCLELAGAEYPKEVKGKAVPAMAGKSLVPVLRGEKREGHEVLAWEHFGARAVRRGDWKMVARAGQGWELYDLSRDRVEGKDLAKDEPARVKEMDALWREWAKENAVVPAPDGKVRVE